jgi:hypothetical protein
MTGKTGGENLKDCKALWHQFRPGDTWHLDRVLLTLHSKRHDLTGVGAQDGHIMAILVQ